MRAVITGSLAALALAVGVAHAATVTVTPPSYTIQPPKFTFTLPDKIGGDPGASVTSGAMVNGHLILTLSNGKTVDAGLLPVPATVEPDLSAVTSRLDALEKAMTALAAGGNIQGGTTNPPPVTTTQWVSPTVDPCAVRNGSKWDTLTIDPTMSIGSALACANQNAKLTLAPGYYAQVAHVPTGLNLDIGGSGANKTFVSGSGGCSVSDNNSGNGCATKLAYRKGVFHVDSPATIHDMTVAYGGWKAQDGHDGQAGIYIDNAQPGTVTITNVMLYKNENGIFANTNSQLAVVVNTSDFVQNGTDGGSHSSYISGGPSVTYNNIHDYGSNLGNNQKGRVPVVNWNGGFSKSQQGRWIEAADGAVMTINGGDFVGNNCCQNMFGNGTESTSKGPGNTAWHGPSRIWLQRNTDFSNAGTFQADSNVTVFMCGDGAAAFNDKGGALNGWTTKGCDTPIPADPAYISGAVSLPPAY